MPYLKENASVGENNENDLLSVNNPSADSGSGASGPTFHVPLPHAITPRSVIGHDKNGKLLILQIDGFEGSYGVSGMDLYELADFAVELGFHSAINLISGVNMLQNGTVVSLPTDKCPKNNIPENGSQYFKCPGVITGAVACVHPLRSTPDPSSARSPSTSTTPHPTTESDPGSTPHTPNHRTPAPFNAPPWMHNTPTEDAYPYGYPPSPSKKNSPTPRENPGINTNSGNSTLLESTFSNLQNSVNFYKFSSEILLGFLVISVAINIFIFAKSRKQSKNGYALARGDHGKHYFYFLFLHLSFYVLLFYVLFIYLFICVFVYLFVSVYIIRVVCCCLFFLLYLLANLCVFYSSLYILFYSFIYFCTTLFSCTDSS